jgi:hypothetical protein
MEVQDHFERACHRWLPDRQMRSVFSDEPGKRAERP